MTNLELTTRFLIHEPRAPDLPYREEHFGFKYASVSIPPAEAAIVLVDCWDEPTIESHGERSAQICRDLIRPLLDSVPRAGDYRSACAVAAGGAEVSPVAAVCGGERTQSTAKGRAGLAAAGLRPASGRLGKFGGPLRRGVVASPAPA